MTSVILVVLLVTSMLAIGSNLTTDAFVQLARRPAALAIAVLANVVLVPAAAAVAVSWVDLPPAVALGIVVSSAACGGSSGPLLVRHARGSLALAVSLQALLAILALVAVPLWMLTLSSGTPFDFGRSAGLVAGLLIAQVVPFLAGMVLRARRASMAARVHGAAGRIADLLLVGIVAWYAVTTMTQVTELPGATLPMIVLLVCLTFASYALPKLNGPRDRSAVSVVTGIRNLTLALLVVSLSDSPELAVTTVLSYGLVMYVVAVATIIPMRRVSLR